MKKACSLLIALVLISACCFAQKNATTKKAKNYIMAETPNFRAARAAIADALKQEPTAETYYWAGMIGYKEVERNSKNQMMGRASDEAVAGAAVIESYTYWLKADQLGQELVLNSKGVKVPADPKIRENINNKMLEYYKQQELIKYGIYLNEKSDFAGAYKAFKMHIDMPNLDMMKNGKLQKEMPRDDVYIQYKYYTAIFAIKAELHNQAIPLLMDIKNGEYEAITINQFLYQEYMEIKDTVNAIATLQSAIVRFPQEPWFLQNLINYYIKSGQEQKAMGYATKALVKAPNVAQYHLIKGYLDERQGNYDVALAEYDAALAINPNLADAIAGKRRLSNNHTVKSNVASNNIHDNKNNGNKKAVTNHASVSKNPPLLALVDGTLSFFDASKNNRIDADEQCSIRFRIQNNGKSAANRCEARVKMSGATGGLSVKSVQLPSIAVGQTYEVNIPISSDINTQDGKVTISIEVYEPSGWGIAPFDLTVATKSYEQPMLQVVDYTIASASGKIKKMEPFTLSFNLQNTQYGNAEQVKVKINLPANVFVMDGDQEQTFPLIKSGEAKPIQLSLVANNNYASTDIPVTIDIKEKYGRFAENKQLSIALNQITSSSFNIAAKDEPRQERKEIQLATIGSAVDKNIPLSATKNENTFVVIIANENYKQVANVPYAINDGNTFKQYCEKTLGIPSHNIHLVSNATYMDIKGQVNWLSGVMDAYQGLARIIFYYAGHGVPDEASKTAFLLPVDGNGSDVTTGYKLDDLYNTLGSMPSNGVMVFMDACFSGSKREEGMLASARGVAVRVRSGQPMGKMVVFSAAQGDETAYPNKDEQHGMFTYYLLKKLQDTKGEVTLQELGNYITTNVRQKSIVMNGKSQTPTVTPSANLSNEWQNWKLK